MIGLEMFAKELNALIEENKNLKEENKTLLKWKNSYLTEQKNQEKSRKPAIDDPVQPQWHPVSEGLPNKSGYYQISIHYSEWVGEDEYDEPGAYHKPEDTVGVARFVLDENGYGWSDIHELGLGTWSKFLKNTCILESRNDGCLWESIISAWAPICWEGYKMD